MKEIKLTDEDYKFLKDLQHELNTQENDGNADPVYWGVMETRLEPSPDGCGEAFIYMGDGVVMTAEEAVRYVDDEIDNDEQLREKWMEVDTDCEDDIADFIRDEMGIQECRVVWQEEKSSISKNTGAFITKRACKEYIEKYRYNHSNPQTYALTAYRNHELERLLNILKNLE